MVSAIPTVLKNVPKTLEKHQIVEYNFLKPGFNKGCILTCKITHVITR